jgi:ABC-type transport system involved in multi-copper enzyme maturation permease subunit
MSTVAVTSAREQTRASQGPGPLLAVLTWELRRFAANRTFWLQALGFFCLALFVTWAGHSDIGFVFGNVTFDGHIANTSPWGMLQRLPNSGLLLLGLLLPFINTEGVTRDLSRRTHELLMTTAMPSKAYVWGRYLIGLLMSLGLALLLLAAYLVLGVLWHLVNPAYPLPAVGGVLLLWVGMVVPATVLLSSLSFALGTVLPRQATLVKIAVLLGWFVGVLILPAIAGLSSHQSSPPTWYIAWDPTSAATSFGTAPQYFSAVDSLIGSSTSTAQAQQMFIAIENRAPDVSSWLAPHLIEAGLSLLLVAAAAFAFRRFRNAFGA